MGSLDKDVVPLAWRKPPAVILREVANAIDEGMTDEQRAAPAKRLDDALQMVSAE